MQHGAIGVFDSGVGGLSVLRQIRALLPAEQLIYVADSAYIPYGTKSSHAIETRALHITEFMRIHGSKAVVVACNTATAAAVATLRKHFAFPIIGMEPGLKPAAALTKTGVVGVLATPGTLASQKFAALLRHHGATVEVVVQACPGLVEHIERGDIDGLQVRALVQRFVAPLIARDADILVLGCTHYSFVEKLIRDAAGPMVTLVETGAAVALELKRRLIAQRSLALGEAKGAEEFWTSGDPATVAPVLARLWNDRNDGNDAGTALTVHRLPESSI